MKFIVEERKKDIRLEREIVIVERGKTERVRENVFLLSSETVRHVA